MKIWELIKADQFFPKYCPKITSHKKKISGKNWRGNPIGFTEQEIKQIQKGIDKMYKDLKKGEP